MTLLSTYWYFLLKTKIFVTAKSDQDPDPRWSGFQDSDPQEVKSWIRISIKINADTQHWKKRFAALLFNNHDP
jgi:hypothetical protein